MSYLPEVQTWVDGGPVRPQAGGESVRVRARLRLGGDNSQIRLPEALTQRASFKQETGGATAGHAAGGGHSPPRHAHCVCLASVWLNPGLLPRGVPGRAKTPLCVAEKSFICHRDIVY